MNDRPIMWRPDPLIEKQMRLECLIALHRQAGKRGFSCMPKRSYISGGYTAEINQHVPTGQYYEDQPHIQKHVIRPNVALGSGPTPLEAAVDGYRKAVPMDDMMATIYLECELHLLGEAIRVFGKLDAALEDLEACRVHVGVCLAFGTL